MSTASKIYIDIQSLLEIRQSALVSIMGEEQALALIHTPEYYGRETDEFPVDMDKFQEMVSGDISAALRHATVTYMVATLTNRISQVEKLSTFNNDSGQTELIVNTHPFRLPDNVVEKFRDALFVKLGIPVHITLVNTPLEEWTPTFLKHSGIQQFYCYDGARWLGHFTEQLATGCLRDVRLFFPSIGRAKLEKKQLKDIQRLGFRDVFAYTEFIFAPYTKIQFLPTIFYSNLISAIALLDGFDAELRKTPLTPQDETAKEPAE